MKCDACGDTWATTGLAYPQVEIEPAIEPEYTRPRVVRHSEYLVLVKRVQHLFPPDAVIRPGTAFGPLVGDVWVEDYGDIAWVNPWTVLIREGAFRALSSKVPSLVAVEPALTPLGGGSPLVELYAPPGGRAAADAEVPISACAQCGRVGASVPDDLVVTELPDPVDTPLFRLPTLPSVILTSEPLAEGIRELSLAGGELDEVTVLPTAERAP